MIDALLVGLGMFLVAPLFYWWFSRKYLIKITFKDKVIGFIVIPSLLLIAIGWINYAVFDSHPELIRMFCNGQNSY